MLLLLLILLMLDNSFLGIEIEKSDCKRVESKLKGTFETFVSEDENPMCKGKLRLKKDGQVYCFQITDSHDDSFKCSVTSSISSPNNGKTGKVNAWLDTVNCLDNWEKNLRLGDAYLSTSARSECARARFTIGLLTLHNFQYELAIEMFEKAEAAEMSESGRSYPMAMWGAAMATTQILWQSSDCEKGKKYLQRIPKGVDWITEKEKAYIQTGFALYPRGIKCEEDDQFARERRFMNAMENVTKLYPEETEAALFHAVSSAAVAAQTPCIGKNCPKTKKENQKKKAINELRTLTHDQELHYELHHECCALNWLRKNSISRLTEKNSSSLRLAQKVLLWLFTESCSAVVVAVAVTVAGTVPVTDAIGAVIVATILLVSSENVWKVFYSYTLCKCKL